MSGPISSLKKLKRPPFRISHDILSNPVSPRSSELSPIDLGDDDLNTLAEDVTSHIVSQRMKETRKTLPPLLRTTDRSSSTAGDSSSITNVSNQNPSSDFELMSVMMSKITQLERRVHEQSVELSEKNQRVQVLEEKLRLLQRANSPSYNRERVVNLEKKCSLLQEQVHEMEDFLADYGLLWVGESTYDEILDDEEDASGSSTDRSLLQQPHEKVWEPQASVSKEFKMNFNLVISQLQELNLMAGADEAEVEHTTSGIARLKRPKAVPLTLFANGIVMFEGPFRPYTCPTTQSCMNDIMDGYFPSELETRYPDGVPIEVTDKRNVYFKDPKSQLAFKGAGHRLGGTRSTSVLVDRPEDAAVQHEVTEASSELPGNRLTLDQFLGHLPASVIRDGKVIDVRNSVKNTMLGKESVQCTVVETPSVRELQERVESGRREVRTVSGARVATVRVKSEDGRNTFVMRMKFEETIADLKAYLDAKRPVALKDSYDLLGDFPRRPLSDDAKTLEECGLVPNATVFLKKRKT